MARVVHSWNIHSKHAAEVAKAARGLKASARLPTTVLYCQHCFGCQFAMLDSVSCGWQRDDAAARAALLSLTAVPCPVSSGVWSVQEIPTRRASGTYVRSNDKVQCSELCPALHVANECARLRVSTVPVTVAVPEFNKLEQVVAAQYAPLAHAPWWTADASSEAPPEAVFPSAVPCLDNERTPLTPSQLAVCQHRASFFHLLGQLVGQSFADGRLLDLPLATPFLRAVIQRERLLDWKAIATKGDLARQPPFHLRTTTDLKRDMADLREVRHGSWLRRALPCLLTHIVSGTTRRSVQVDPVLATSMAPIVELVLKLRALRADDTLNTAERDAAIAGLRIDGATLEDLCLSFELPDCPDVPLWPVARDPEQSTSRRLAGAATVAGPGAGAGVDAGSMPAAEEEPPLVTLDTVDDYVTAVMRETLVTPVLEPALAFRQGFATIIDPRCLLMFTPAELKEELCGRVPGTVEAWSPRQVLAAIRCDHGYTESSRAVGLLVDAMCSFTPLQRREFVQFTTGSSRLPAGGLAALEPPLTVVKKYVDEGESPDCFLPSASTCTNYLKLPDYSCSSVLQRQLGYAVREGRASFLLS